MKIQTAIFALLAVLVAPANGDEQERNKEVYKASHRCSDSPPEDAWFADAYEAAMSAAHDSAGCLFSTVGCFLEGDILDLTPPDPLYCTALRNNFRATLVGVDKRPLFLALREAANLGSVAAMAMVADSYRTGYGTPISIDQAVTWILVARAHGFRGADFMLDHIRSKYAVAMSFATQEAQERLAQINANIIAARWAYARWWLDEVQLNAILAEIVASGNEDEAKGAALGLMESATAHGFGFEGIDPLLDYIKSRHPTIMSWAIKKAREILAQKDE